ncbi:MAG: hypothetical protein KVP17_003601 [Porospora cf. gigantea B]|uniref:uncharacterized protein n=1 Tax=Porospora cf. gigantea B TaxID=2853592 RepID=UPI003571B5EF|nr:MAG: hypothetical protein KVP17_003601 [Porospora cf. gigantea B]
MLTPPQTSVYPAVHTVPEMPKSADFFHPRQRSAPHLPKSEALWRRLRNRCTLRWTGIEHFRMAVQMSASALLCSLFIVVPVLSTLIHNEGRFAIVSYACVHFLMQINDSH